MKERTRQRLLREQRAGACANHCSFPCTAKSLRRTAQDLALVTAMDSRSVLTIRRQTNGSYNLLAVLHGGGFL